MTGKAPFLKPTVPSGVNVGRDILLPEELSDHLLLGSLEKVFATDDDLEAVAVHWGSGSAYALRADVLDALAPTTMRSVGDFGAADQMFLAGKAQLDPIRLDCPVDGQRFEVFFLNPGETPVCPRHRDTRLEVVVDG
jgi:hypothetical protein